MRETGPVRKFLDGDAEAAAPYIGPARVLLGMVKNLMHLGGRAQGWQRWTLPDGTTLMASSQHGRDRIAIIGPRGAETELKLTPEQLEPVEVPTPAEPEPIETPFETNVVYVCGACTFLEYAFGTPIQHPFLWRPGHAPIDLGLPAGGVSAWANAISCDGHVVVGGYITSDDTAGAWRWDAVDGMRDLGVLSGERGHTMAATGVNTDGNVIAGHGPLDLNAGTSCNWVWTRAQGMRMLDGAESEKTDQSNIVKVSPNGAYIAGLGLAQRVQTRWFVEAYISGVDTKYRIVPGYTQPVRGTLWRGAAGVYSPNALPASGLVQNYIAHVAGPAADGVNGDYRLALPLTVIPTNVSDTGVVCGYAGTIPLIAHNGAVTYIVSPGTTPEPAIGDPTVSQEVFALPTGRSGTPSGITGGGGRVAGTFDDGAAFVWARSRLDTPFQGRINDMARDGTRYVGDVPTDIATTPMMWSAAGPTAIPLLPGSIGGSATGIAHPGARVPPIPPEPIPLDN